LDYYPETKKQHFSKRIKIEIITQEIPVPSEHTEISLNTESKITQELHTKALFLELFKNQKPYMDLPKHIIQGGYETKAPESFTQYESSVLETQD